MRDIMQLRGFLAIYREAVLLLRSVTVSENHRSCIASGTCHRLFFLVLTVYDLPTPSIIIVAKESS
jgi:hypothetical protein